MELADPKHRLTCTLVVNVAAMFGWHEKHVPESSRWNDSVWVVWVCQVMESWTMILRGSLPMSITLEDVRVYAGDSMAYVTCVEVIEVGDSRGR